MTAGPGSNSGPPDYIFVDKCYAFYHPAIFADSRVEKGISLMSFESSRAGSPLGWGPAQIQPALLKARLAAKASPGRRRTTQGRAQPVRTGRSPVRAGSPLG